VKRILFHLLFWAAYIFQDSVLVFTWVGPSLHKMPDTRLAIVSLASAFVMTIPKIIIAYFILLYSLKKIGSGTYNLFYSVLEIFIIVFLTILVYRVLSKYLVNPYIYDSALRDQPLVNIRGILMALMDIGFVTCLAVALKLIRSQLKTKEREKELIKEKLGAELKFLRNQTNPHFLMNTLNNIYGLARKKSDETAEVVMKLSELLRFMLYESNGGFILLKDEIKILEDYLELERIRNNNRLKVIFTKETDNDKYEIAPFLLLPFVENSFKHGVSETRFESFINITMKAKDGYLNFMIENSKDEGNGTQSSNNIGLNNVRRQLELVYKEYKLDTINNGSTYKVSLDVNLTNHAIS